MLLEPPAHLEQLQEVLLAVRIGLAGALGRVPGPGELRLTKEGAGAVKRGAFVQLRVKKPKGGAAPVDAQDGES